MEAACGGAAAAFDRLEISMAYDPLCPKGKTIEDVLQFARTHGCTMLDIRFMDLPGLWQHYTFPIRRLDVECFTEGFAFDGSSLRGCQKIKESDMLLIPDPETALIDPFIQSPTLSVIANVEDPVSRERYTRDARFVAQKAETVREGFGRGRYRLHRARAEFFIFDEVRFASDQHASLLLARLGRRALEHRRRSTLRGDLNQGYQPRYKGGYFPVSPHDTQTDIRNGDGADPGSLRHPDRTAPPRSGDGRPGRDRHAVRHADEAWATSLLLYKYVVKNVAKRHGKDGHVHAQAAVRRQRFSGMHTHLSIWRDGNNLFAGDEYAGLSKTCALRTSRASSSTARR
jgi:glutamine synthetase